MSCIADQTGHGVEVQSGPSCKAAHSVGQVAGAQHARNMQVLFCFELTVASMVRSGYFASLYFWIDLAATLSMLLDITRLMDLIFNQSTMAGSPALTRLVQNKVSAMAQWLVW